jgi:hypothetical protein
MGCSTSILGGMTFWQNTWSNIFGGIGAGLFFLLCYMVLQWFLQATDLVVSYNWRYDNIDGVITFRPFFDIRNRSRSRIYRLANIAYTRNSEMYWVENDSIMGTVIEPGSMNFIAGAPVKNVGDTATAFGLEVTIRTQSGRSFWLRGEGPGQQGKSRIRRVAFTLRAKLEKLLVPLE